MNNSLINQKQKSIRILYYLIYIYFILKPFYIFSSGSIQISDIFLLISCGTLFFIVKKSKTTQKVINKKMYLFNLFLFFVISISLIYSIIYFRTDFLMSASFYIFNSMGIYVLYYCMEDIKFLNNIKKIFIINILIQFLLYIFNLGTWYGTVRYMGTFNDPNQFAFFIFSSLIIIYILEKILKNKNNLIIYIISSFLIFQSGSTGMLLGLSIFIINIFINILIKFNLKKLQNYIAISLIFIIPIILIIILTSNNLLEKIKTFNQDNFVISRVKEKIERAEVEEGNLLQERGYDKILNYPYKIILGAGHGYHERYISYHTGEIHATFPSILFYYGIVPFIILLIWIWKNIRYTPLSIKMMYFAIFVESLTLLNQRQISFWLIIILGSYYKKLKVES